MIAADFNFERITKWSGANEGERGPGEQAHFAQSERGRARFRKLTHDGAAAHGQFGKFDNGAHRDGTVRPKRVRSARSQLLDEDTARGAVAQGDTCPIYLTENCRVAGDFRDEGGFAETHLSHPLAKISVPREFADPTCGSGRKLAEGDPNVDWKTRHESSDDSNETQFQ